MVEHAGTLTPRRLALASCRLALVGAALGVVSHG
jgi:hypothetical protein